jgi:phosphoribosylformylglycinamidine synthase II
MGVARAEMHTPRMPVPDWRIVCLFTQFQRRIRLAIADGQWREVALSDSEYAQILELLGREPSLVELGMFGAMWSEHCGYKHSRPHLKTLPTEAEWVIQGPGENAGAVDIGNGLAAVFKVESHNHPSAVEPYEGAATGVGGIVRDIFTMGARPVAILDALRFGPLDEPRNRYLFENVVAGIGGYGNCLGIPTVGGEIAFDRSYNGNPLVNAMAVGIVEHDKIVRAKASGIGNAVILIGAETGRDGLHGATFASVDDPEASHRGVIQVGNPFLEKQLMEACLSLLQGDAVVAMQDLGAAGLTSSIVECASRGGVGVDVDVKHVPRRETGMTAYEIMLSESQERMVLVAPPDRIAEITAELERWSLTASVIGTITDTGRIVIRDNGAVEVDVPVTYFIDECPTYLTSGSEPASIAEAKAFDIRTLPDISPVEVPSRLLDLLGSPNICSRYPVWEQYDHTILTNTVFGPGQADAAVLRVKGTSTGIAMSIDCNSRYCSLDPYLGAAHSVAEAARNVSVAGARALGLTNCLNMGNPERNPGSWHLEQSVAGIGAAGRALNVPVVSGNVSLYNETANSPVQPTPMIGCVGVVDDIQHVSAATWAEGDTVLLLGSGSPVLGGSEYLERFHDRIAGALPELDLESEKALHASLVDIARSGASSGAHDISLGGLAVSLAELAIASGVGASVNVAAGERLDSDWFGESAGRVIVSASASRVNEIEQIASRHGVNVAGIGTVGGTGLVLGDAPAIPVSDLHAAFDSGFNSASTTVVVS